MAIDETVVRHLERLAALRLGDDERRRLADRLARVVAYVEQLRELDTSAAAPADDGATARRPDEPSPSLPAAEATAPAPAVERGHFAVPPVFGGDDG
jgi:aspartyl-tRNA(Asn)/glutamyl-tRNA(Gln) amidotransferase subunit C